MAKSSDTKDDVAGVIAPPPLIYFGFLAFGLGLSYFWPVTIFGMGIPTVGRLGIGGALIGIGAVIGIVGLFAFRKARTNVRPDRETTALITQGIYRYSRNPLYLSAAVVYAGIAFASNSMWALGSLIPALVVIRCGVIAREEIYLEGKFGEAYQLFKETVPRWL